ncbi:MAG TPA: hypothetical protein GX506_00400, partial [Firmicutes bacterium]|nr:hypothetical protein [Bacillota bacterium]
MPENEGGIMMAGRIELITGPMFAGKTKELLMRREQHGRMLLTPPVRIPRVLGTEREAFRFTHDGRPYNAISCDNLVFEIHRLREDWEYRPMVFAIDEVQFFPPEVVPVIERAAREWGWVVVCAGLDEDFAGRHWETVSEILAIADCLVRLRAR